LSFFEPPPPAPERRPPSRHPEWLAPPENEIGASVPLRLVLVRTPMLAIALLEAVAYSTGFTLRLSVRIHPDADGLEPRELMSQLHGMPRGSGDDRLRFGIQFSDGRKATNLGPRLPPPDEPPDIRLTPHGGGGGGGLSWQIGYWIYPLPPPGPLTLAIAWPAQDVGEETYSVDASPIIEAAAGSAVLWEDNRPVRGSAPPPTLGQAGRIEIAEP
jgi:hypothetical protein